MQIGFINTLLNPGFDFWDYGAGPFTVSGYTASRWKLNRTGSPTVSIQKGSTPSDTSIAKWIRGTNCLDINVSAINPGDNVQVRQIVSNGTRLGNQTFSLSGIAFGPDGASFYVGFNNFFKKVTTKGANVPVKFEFIESIDDPATQLSVDCFDSPSQTGLFKIAFIQLEALRIEARPSSFELRNAGLERGLLNRYVFPVRAGQTFVSSTTSAFAAVEFPVEMRVTPTYRALKSADIAISSVTTGTSNPSTAPITNTASGISTTGARVALQNGWTGLANGSLNRLETDYIGLFEADY